MAKSSGCEFIDIFRGKRFTSTRGRIGSARRDGWVILDVRGDGGWRRMELEIWTSRSVTRSHHEVRDLLASRTMMKRVQVWYGAARVRHAERP